MAKKSFKSGVKNIIDSIENPKTPTTSPKKNKEQKGDGIPANTISIVLTSVLTVQNAVAVKSELDNALKGKQVAISSNEITEIDLSVIQLLIAFEKSAIQKNIEVDWQLQPTDDVRKLVKLSGLNHFLGFCKPVESV